MPLEEEPTTLHLGGTPRGLRIEFHPSGSATVYLQKEDGNIFLGIQDSLTLLQELHAWAAMTYFSPAFGAKVALWFFSALLSLLFRNKDIVRPAFVTQQIGRRLIAITHLAPMGLGFFISGSLDYPTRKLAIWHYRNGKPQIETVLPVDRKSLFEWRAHLKAMSICQ